MSNATLCFKGKAKNAHTEAADDLDPQVGDRLIVTLDVEVVSRKMKNGKPEIGVLIHRDKIEEAQL